MRDGPITQTLSHAWQLLNCCTINECLLMGTERWSEQANFWSQVWQLNSLYSGSPHIGRDRWFKCSNIMSQAWQLLLHEKAISDVDVSFQVYLLMRSEKGS